ncbi:hypothetical protein LCGC14_1578990 [marine sediment metagenome]|uniref:Nuclease associated modular domain-containing protein n=1 Tax=marine sediment metagenome TaxID=412755 RepID=A0A0F9IHM2_9ZZZZ
MTEEIYCKCGCGVLIPNKAYRANGKLYQRSYVVGHNPNGLKGTPLSAERRKKISESSLGKPGTRKGAITSKETKEKIRASNLGQKRTKEARLNMRLAHLGKPAPNKGKKLPQRSGANHHNWKGGISPECNKIRTSLEGKIWERAVFDKCGCKCILCGKFARSAHHIMNFSAYPELRFDTDNGTAFCRGCHKQFHLVYGKRNNSQQQVDEFLKQGVA